jgi:hypothetical protein
MKGKSHKLHTNEFENKQTNIGKTLNFETCMLESTFQDLNNENIRNLRKVLY